MNPTSAIWKMHQNGTRDSRHSSPRPKSAQLNYQHTVLITIIYFYICAYLFTGGRMITMKAINIAWINLFRSLAGIDAPGRPDLSHPGRIWNTNSNRSADIHLPAGRVRSLDPARIKEIVCLEGSVWVTQSSRPGDFFLLAGDSFIPHPTGKIVVEALEDSVVMLECPHNHD
jgi:Protein of unknown function (DUF2917)